METLLDILAIKCSSQKKQGKERMWGGGGSAFMAGLGNVTWSEYVGGSRVQAADSPSPWFSKRFYPLNPKLIPNHKRSRTIVLADKEIDKLPYSYVGQRVF